MADQIQDYFKFKPFTIASLKANDDFIVFINKKEVGDAIDDNDFFTAYSLANKYGYPRSLTVVLLKAGINPLLHLKVLPQKIFESCNYIEELTVPETIERIGAEAFSASTITTINIPASVEYIGQQAFSNIANPLTINYDGSAGDFNDIEFGRDVF